MEPNNRHFEARCRNHLHANDWLRSTPISTRLVGAYTFLHPGANLAGRFGRVSAPSRAPRPSNQRPYMASAATCGRLLSHTAQGRSVFGLLGGTALVGCDRPAGAQPRSPSCHQQRPASAAPGTTRRPACYMSVTGSLSRTVGLFVDLVLGHISRKTPGAIFNAPLRDGSRRDTGQSVCMLVVECRRVLRRSSHKPRRRGAPWCKTLQLMVSL